MKRIAITATLLLPMAAFAADTAQERLDNAATVFSEIMSTPDKGIPQDLLAKSQCVVIVPGLKKAAFVVGAEFGRGFAECRHPDGTGWGAPGSVRIEGGSWGLQIGGSSTDVVMLVMNREGMNKLLGDKFTLGADASVAAGPVGRTVNADTDVKMTAEILAGAPHPVPSWWRHSAKPRPNSAPTTKAAFLSPGTITTHCDLASKSCGIPFSGVLIISEKTVAAVASRSCAVSAAKAAIGSNNVAAIAMRFIRISLDNYYRRLHRLRQFCLVRKRSDKTNPAAGPLRSARPVEYKG